MLAGPFAPNAGVLGVAHAGNRLERGQRGAAYGRLTPVSWSRPDTVIADTLTKRFDDRVATLRRGAACESRASPAIITSQSRTGAGMASISARSRG